MSVGTEPKKRRTYWLTSTVTAQSRDRALLLNQKAYDVRFFTSLDGLIAELETQRAGVIVVSDDDELQQVEKIILTLLALPEIQGARLILTVTKKGEGSERLRYLAACGNFRDIVPMDMDDRQWVQRFIFATAGRSMQYTQPSGQISLNNISAVSLPTRVTAIDSQRLRIESRVRPAPGAILNLSGPLAEAMGVASITVKVEATQRSHLLYRFSDAVVATWSVPAAAKPHAQMFMNNLKAQQTNHGPRCRIFIAMQSAALRHAILARFEDPRFEISTALQKQSIVDEPRFFTPDIIFIEDQLCLEDNGARFDQMMASLTEHTTVLIYGRHEITLPLRQKHHGRRILTFHKLPKNLAETVLTRFMPSQGHGGQGLANDASHLSADSPYSLAELTFPARLLHIHPHAASLALPHYVGDFALCRIESPLLRRLLGRNPYIKITSTYTDSRADQAGFQHLADGYLADLDQSERQAVSHGLIRLMTEHLARFESSAPGTMLADTAAARTPELGTAAAPPRQVFIPEPPKVAAGASAVATVTYPGHSATFKAVQASAALANPPQIEPLTPTSAPNVERLRRPERLARYEKIALPDDANLNISPNDEKIEGLETDFLSQMLEALSSKSFKQFVGYTAVIAFLIAILWAMITVVAPSWDTHSGDVYSEQLKRFAPHLNRPTQ